MQYSVAVVSPDDLTDERAWIQSAVHRIGEKKIQELVYAAQQGQKNAYPPYSNYHVGAAVLCVSGAIFSGCNTEVVSWSQTSHAEQNAITNAICDGEVRRDGRKFIEVVAVVGKETATPCGHCRQIMAEHCDNALIIMAGEDGVVRAVTSLKTILPFAFTPKALGIE